jgi:RNA polymerase sigma factor (sigma-70 family)
MVARFALRLGGPSRFCGDIVQEVFLVMQGRAEFPQQAKVTTWLCRITENVVRRRRQRERQWYGFGSKDSALNRAESTRPKQIQELERGPADVMVYRVLDRMRTPARNLIIMFELEGQPGEEIAERTGTQLATVRVQLHRARAQFMRLFGERAPARPGDREGAFAAWRSR